MIDVNEARILIFQRKPGRRFERSRRFFEMSFKCYFLPTLAYLNGRKNLMCVFDFEIYICLVFLLGSLNLIKL